MTRSKLDIEEWGARGKTSSTIRYRESLQKALSRRIEENEVSFGGDDFLGLTKIDHKTAWILESVIADEMDHASPVDISAMQPIILDLTLQNFKFIQGIHDKTARGSSYIINRLLESCRLDVAWCIEPANKDDIERAKVLLAKYKRNKHGRRMLKVTADSLRLDKEKISEP